MSNLDRLAAVRETLAGVDTPVRLLFFEQSIGCDTCAPTRQLLKQLAGMSPHISVEVLNLILDKDRAALHGVDRVPAVVVSSPHRDRIRFYGAPFGYELMSLVEAIRLTAAGESGLSAESQAKVATLKAPVRLQVFFTPTCVYCPQMVNLANRLAIESPQISATAVDATESPDLVRRYSVNGVPKTIINETAEIIGAVTEEELITAVLQQADIEYRASGVGHRASGVGDDA